jgi:hypothetical protein
MRSPTDASLPPLRASAHRCITLAAKAFIHRLQGANKPTQHSVSRLQRHMALYHLAMANYVPPKIDSDVTAIVCERNANLY